MNAKSYFRNIFDNVTSIAIGMKITLKYCFQKTVTVQYPEQHLTFAPRYRGIHEFEADKCIACDMCAKACPVDCIYIDKTAPRKIDKKTGKATGGELLRFAIDYSKCLFCALCTEPCPTDCIHMGKLHDLSSYTREDVIVEFAEIDKQNLRQRWVASAFDGAAEKDFDQNDRPSLGVVENHDPVQRNARAGKPLKLGDKQYTSGLFCHANSKVVLRNLPAPVMRFAALAGV